MKTNKKGLIHIYTGNGKGKTTSAVGLGIRALGHGYKLCYASFHKNPEKYGYNEISILKKLNTNILIFAKGHPHLDKNIDENEITNDIKKAIIQLYNILQTEYFDMLIMDEILISVRDGYLEEEQLIRFIKNKPEHLELIITGRGATSQIMELADYVSEIQKIKHPFDQGLKSREGIEY